MATRLKCPGASGGYCNVGCREDGSGPQGYRPCEDAVLEDDGPLVPDFSGAIDGKGYKVSMDDPKKLPLSLIPTALLNAAGRVLGYGAKKYASHNWRRGMHYSEVYSALQRHLGAWNDGEDTDPESGLNHLDHATACIAFLTEYVAHQQYAQFDDRFKRPKAQEAASAEDEE